jgi:hypothetical protein
MSFIDYFAWFVLLFIFVAMVVAIFVALGMAPGRIAQARTSVGASGRIGGWATLIFAFPFWPLVLIWAFVDVPAETGAAAMMNVLLLGYIAILALFVWIG